MIREWGAIGVVVAFGWAVFVVCAATAAHGDAVRFNWVMWAALWPSQETQFQLGGGENCTSTEPASCKKQFAARLVVDNKIVAEIPMDVVPEKDRARLLELIRGIRFEERTQ